MTLAQLLSDYGYLAVFAGSVLEGETLVALAGYMAHGGYLHWPRVVALAFVGATLGDQFFYFVGRRYGTRLQRRWPRFDAAAQRVEARLRRHDAAVIVGVRFMYGVRILGPIAIGMSGVPARRFLAFNLLGAALWAPAVAGAGYLFGQSMQWLFNDVEHAEIIGIVGLVLLMLAVGGVQRWRARRRRDD